MAFDTAAIDMELEKHRHDSSYNALEVYRSVSPLADRLYGCMDEIDIYERDSFIPAINALKELLSEIHGQAVRCSELRIEDEEDFMDFANWIAFWGGLFGDEGLFRAAYPGDILGDIYDFWQLAVEFADSILSHEGWSLSFSELLLGFSSGVAEGNRKTESLLSQFTGEKLNEIILVYRNSVDMLIELLAAAEDALDKRKIQ